MSREHGQEALTPRQIGDLYWKKRKKMFAAAMGNTDFFYAAGAEHVWRTGRNGKDVPGDLDFIVLKGNEFKEWPPTAGGDDALTEGVMRAIQAKEQYAFLAKEAGNQDGFSARLDRMARILEKMLGLWFPASGIDEKTGKPVSGTIRRRSGEDLRVAAKEYEEEVRSFNDAALPRFGKAAPVSGKALAEGKVPITCRLVSPSDPGEYGKHIPENYLEQARKGELIIEAFYRGGDAEEGQFLGLSVTGIHLGWAEIVYLYFAGEKKKPEVIAEFLRAMIGIEYERSGGGLTGAFIEMPLSEADPAIQEGLRLAGMEVMEGKGNVYCFRLSDVREREMLWKASEAAQLLLLKDADSSLRKDLEHRMESDPMPIPVSMPVEWEEYLPELSMILLEEGNPAGAVLMAARGEFLVLELAYAATRTALPKLLGGVLRQALKLYGEDQELLVPIVARHSEELLERIVPGGMRYDYLGAVLWYAQWKN
ncbi:MAG: hypothetical protein K6F35_05885 [Lachnospiraceae bacterium]|nr:hypothetical protein [Lachnospiraceae bacterium]